MAIKKEQPKRACDCVARIDISVGIKYVRHVSVRALAHSRIKQIRMHSRFTPMRRATEKASSRLRCVLRIFRYQVCRMRRRPVFTGIVTESAYIVTCVHARQPRRGSLRSSSDALRTRVIRFRIKDVYYVSFVITCYRSLSLFHDSIWH